MFFRTIIFVSVTFIISNILFLSVAVASNLPINFTESLKKEACVIPTKLIKWGDHTLQYIISGEFAHPGQKDIAVICYIMDKVYLRISWGGKFQCQSKVKIYGPAIHAVGEQYIVSHFQAYGGPNPPKITHQGIDHGSEKGSIVHYCHKGKWLELSGAD